MKQEAAVLRSTPLPVHCDCIRQNCNGEVVEFASGCAREIFIRCDPTLRPGRKKERRGSMRKVSTSACRGFCTKPNASMADVVLERVFFRNLHADFDDPSLKCESGPTA